MRRGALRGVFQVQIRAAGREARQSAHRREREKRMEEALLRPPSKLFFFRQVLAPFVFTRFFFHSLFLLVFFLSSPHTFQSPFRFACSLLHR